ncbi:hypothetical protein Glove_583g10 [Diversispora epigaea]|uniref:Uncharacterized protein n=1 Tax=Diversispora epigaea TaxID=1348612 RepID=A0A397G8P6_9GLOM|nr:hypothetical protein Glove_583g10 [Diversispora epigaea]
MSQKSAPLTSLVSTKTYKYVCNCLLCNGKEVVARTQEKHANNKELKEKEAPDSSFRMNWSRLPKLKRDTSISNMLSGMDLDDEIIVALSSRSRKDQFHNPLIEETPDIFDDMLLIS